MQQTLVIVRSLARVNKITVVRTALAYNSLFVLTTERIKEGSRTRRRRSQEKAHWSRHPILATWPQAPKHSREGGIPRSSSIEDPRPNIRARLGGYRVASLT